MVSGIPLGITPAKILPLEFSLPQNLSHPGILPLHPLYYRKKNVGLIVSHVEGFYKQKLYSTEIYFE